MQPGQKLYSKTGEVFTLDHDHGEYLYVRPLIRTITQFSTNSGEDYDEDEFYEPAPYLVSRAANELYLEPPCMQMDGDITKKREELAQLEAEHKRNIRQYQQQTDRAQGYLRDAQNQLKRWIEEHRVIMDIGRLLDGQIMYPLRVQQNHYHRGREIPIIPKMDGSRYIALHSGNFERGQKWVAKEYAEDNYGAPFKFFYTEEERSQAIKDEFEEALRQFRAAPNFDTTSYTAGTQLHYGTLLKWVQTHPTILSMPEDIIEMKKQDEQKAIDARKAQLAKELEQLNKNQAAKE